MPRRVIEGGQVMSRRDYWSQRIGEQEKSGASVQQFCEQQGLTQQSFYLWRRRLRETSPVRFALVESAVASPAVTGSGLELVLTSGERLRIGGDVDVGLLRKVVEALRS